MQNPTYTKPKFKIGDQVDISKLNRKGLIIADKVYKDGSTFREQGWYYFFEGSNLFVHESFMSS